ncbi:hypothetical protein Droror1_Dr00006991 [Drosera rotundifolia]
MMPPPETKPPPLPSPAVTDDEHDPTRHPTTAVPHRKKGMGIKSWLAIDATGDSQIIEAGKHAIMRRTGLPARDLRILDPLLSYPSTVLGRERAIVINMEHIKAIVTAQEVLLLNSRDPSVIPFVEELVRRLMRLHQAAVKNQEAGSQGESTDWTNLYDLEEPQSRENSPQSSGFPPRQGIVNGEGKLEERQDHNNKDGGKVLPFEFVALEACLEAACTCLDNEARTLEQEAHPALDKLTSQISTLNLERVRQIKSRLVTITGRVQKVRDELEHLLDDDEDMAEMYLTEKLIENESSGSSITDNEDDGVGNELILLGADDRAPADLLAESNVRSARYGGDLQNNDNLLFGSQGRESHGTRTSTTHSAISKQVDVEELEMLLEAYFVQIDGTLNKLTTLREYVDDTEDYINIMLDDKQNHLLQMGVMLTTATLVVSAFVVVAGIFGMNIHIDLFNDTVDGMRNFLWTVGGGTAATIFLYLVAIAWCKHKGLLE